MTVRKSLLIRCLSVIVIASLVGCDLLWAYPPTEAPPGLPARRAGGLRARRASERASARPVLQKEPRSQAATRPALAVGLNLNRLAAWWTQLRDRTWWLRLHDRTRIAYYALRITFGLATFIGMGGFLYTLVHSASRSWFTSIMMVTTFISFWMAYNFYGFLLAHHLVKRSPKAMQFRRVIGAMSDVFPWIEVSLALCGLVILPLVLFLARVPGAPPLITLSVSLLVTGGILSLVLTSMGFLVWPEEWRFFRERIQAGPSYPSLSQLEVVTRVAHFAAKHRLPLLARRVAQELALAYLPSPQLDVREGAAALFLSMANVYHAGAVSTGVHRPNRVQREVSGLEQEALWRWAEWLRAEERQHVMNVRTVLEEAL